MIARSKGIRVTVCIPVIGKSWGFWRVEGRGDWILGNGYWVLEIGIGYWRIEKDKRGGFVLKKIK